MRDYEIPFAIFVVFSGAVSAYPFDVSLPFKVQYTPGVLGKSETSLNIDFEKAADYLQVQFNSQFEDVRFVTDDSKNHLNFAFTIGLGGGYEFEIGGSGVSQLSIKKNFQQKNQLSDTALL